MLRLDYGGLVIAVEGPAPPVGWLREFLGAAFDDADPHAARAPDHLVRVAYRSPEAVRGDAVELFSLDGDFVRRPAARTPEGKLRVHDEAQGIGYELGGRETAITAGEDGPALRLALLRVVRELATAHALRAGWLHLHAAAVEVGGSIVAIAGRRRSGKTTLLLHALLAGRARYVTNDRLFLDLRADPPAARGMPAIVTLRDETFARFPGFAQRLAASGYARERTIAESSPATPSRPNLSPTQLRVLAGAGESPGGPLGTIVLPTVDAEVPRFEIRALSPGDATARVRDALFLATLPERPARAFAGDAAPRDGAVLDRLCADVAARVPCLEVRLGPDAYGAPAVWDAIRERAR